MMALPKKRWLPARTTLLFNRTSPRADWERGPTLYFLVRCKAMSLATLSSKNQIVIPRDAREALGLKPGDQLLVVVRGDKVIVLQKPKAHHAAIKGLASGLYPSGYLEKERDSWT